MNKKDEQYKQSTINALNQVVVDLELCLDKTQRSLLRITCLPRLENGDVLVDRDTIDDVHLALHDLGSPTPVDNESLSQELDAQKEGILKALGLLKDWTDKGKATDRHDKKIFHAVSVLEGVHE